MSIFSNREWIRDHPLHRISIGNVAAQEDGLATGSADLLCRRIPGLFDVVYDGDGSIRGKRKGDGLADA